MREEFYDKAIPNIQGWDMNQQGSIRCTKCNTGIPDDTGICPKCAKFGHVYIDIYWSEDVGGDGKHYPIRRDENRKRLDFGTAWNIRKDVQSEINKKTFKPWKYLPEEKNPNRCEVFFDKWLAEVEETLSAGTHRAYKSSVDAHFRKYWGKKDIQDGTGNKQIKLWVQSLEKKYKKDSARAIRNRFHAFLTWAAEEGIIEAVSHFKKIKGRDEKKKYALSLEQQFHEVGKIRNEQVKRAIFLMMFTGRRESEILTLKVSDIDLKARSIAIRRTWSDYEIRPTTKTEDPQVIPLPAIALGLVKDCMGDKIGDAWLFPRKDGKAPLHYKQLWRWWHETGSPATIRDATRRSFATIMKNAGMDLKKIGELLGQVSLKTTEIYLKDEPLRLMDEVDAIQGKLLEFRKEKADEREGK